MYHYELSKKLTNYRRFLIRNQISKNASKHIFEFKIIDIVNFYLFKPSADH